MNKQEAIDVLEIFKANTEHILGEENEVVKAIKTCMMLVKEIETKQGEWINLDDGSLSWKCSNCGKHCYGCYSEIKAGEYHYCPHCGTKMGEA